MGKQHIQNVVSAFNYEVEAENARRLFDEDKDGLLVEKYGGDVAKTALESLIATITSDPYRREAHSPARREVEGGTGRRTPHGHRAAVGRADRTRLARHALRRRGGLRGDGLRDAEPGTRRLLRSEAG